MRLLSLFALIVTSVFAQDPAPTPPPAPAHESEGMRATRHAFMLVSTRAVALFQSADTIQARLSADGSSLHPATVTLRFRIEHTLDRIEAAIGKGDKANLEYADKEIKVADELVNRFARRLGGE